MKKQTSAPLTGLNHIYSMKVYIILQVQGGILILVRATESDNFQGILSHGVWKSYSKTRGKGLVHHFVNKMNSSCFFFQFDFHSELLLQPLQAVREFLDRGSVCRDWPEFQWEAGILQIRWLITWPQASRRAIPHPLRCQNWHPVMNRLKLLWNILNYRSLAATTRELRLIASWAYRKASHILLKSPTLNPLIYFKLALAHDFLYSVKTMKLLPCQNMEFGEI